MNATSCVGATVAHRCITCTAMSDSSAAMPPVPKIAAAPGRSPAMP